MKEQNRSELRKSIMTILYQIQLYQKNKISYDLDSLMKDTLKMENEFVKEIIYGVTTCQKEIDQYANQYLKNWTIDRFALPDQAILRIGIYELLYTDTPPIVAINEAVELANHYSSEDVKKMINGVLDHLYHDQEDRK